MNKELKYDEYIQYEVEPKSIGFDNIGHKFIFENGYGASVICDDFSYGGKKGLFELAVLKKVTDNKCELCYDTPITDDVLGWLSNDEVLELLEKIKNLKKV